MASRKIIQNIIAKIKQFKTYFYQDNLFHLNEIRLYQNVNEYTTLTIYIDYFIYHNNITLFNITKITNYGYTNKKIF